MFKTIELYNFRHFKEQKIELQPGLNCIVGKNGVGKSTLIECIGFVMYGSGQLRGKVSASVGSKTIIRIVGTFPTDWELLRTGGKTEFTYQETKLLRATDVKKFFEDIFCSAETFTSVFVAHQRAVSEIAILRPGERKRRLCELLGLMAVEKATTALKDIVRGLHKPIVSEEAVAQTLVEVEAMGKHSLSSLMSIRKLQGDLKRVRALEMPPEQARPQLDGLDAAIQGLQKFISQAEGIIGFKHAAFRLLTNQDKCLLCFSKLDPITHKTFLGKQIDAGLAEVKELQTRLDAANSLKSKLTSIASEPLETDILKQLGEAIDLDVDTIWTQVADANQTRGKYEHLQTEWSAYKERMPDLELGIHFQNFLPFVMSEKFARLEELVTRYLREYSKFNTFRFDDQGNMFVDDKPLKELSVGECDLACLIFRVSLAQMFGEEQFGEPPIAIFDSSFDAVDDDNMVTALELLSDSPFRQIIVTSHREDVARRLGVNTIIMEG